MTEQAEGTMRFTIEAGALVRKKIVGALKAYLMGRRGVRYEIEEVYRGWTMSIYAVRVEWRGSDVKEWESIHRDLAQWAGRVVA